MHGKRALRVLQLLATGGIMLQVTGCASGLAPALLSLAESVTLDLLFGFLTPGL